LIVAVVVLPVPMGAPFEEVKPDNKNKCLPVKEMEEKAK
jgi:hypothetical protein